MHIHFYTQLSFSVQRFMSVMKVYISVNILAPIHTVLMFALATVASLSQAMDSPAVVRIINIIILSYPCIIYIYIYIYIYIFFFKSRY